MTLRRTSIQTGMTNLFGIQVPEEVVRSPHRSDSRRRILDARRWIEAAAERADGTHRRRVLQEIPDGLRQFAIAHRRRRHVQGAIAEPAHDLLVVIVMSLRHEFADACEQGGNWQGAPPSLSCPCSSCTCSLLS